MAAAVQLLSALLHPWSFWRQQWNTRKNVKWWGCQLGLAHRDLVLYCLQECVTLQLWVPPHLSLFSPPMYIVLRAPQPLLSSNRRPTLLPCTVQEQARDYDDMPDSHYSLPSITISQPRALCRHLPGWPLTHCSDMTDLFWGMYVFTFYAQKIWTDCT